MPHAKHEGEHSLDTRAYLYNGNALQLFHVVFDRSCTSDSVDIYFFFSRWRLKFLIFSLQRVHRSNTTHAHVDDRIHNIQTRRIPGPPFMIYIILL